MKLTRSIALVLALLFAHTSVAALTIAQGYDAFEEGDVSRAVEIWTTLAEQGDSTAQVNLGQLYRLGRGVAQDDSEAVKWYRMAAQQGSETALFNLLMMEEDGRVTEADLALTATEQSSKTGQNRDTEVTAEPDVAEVAKVAEVAEVAESAEVVEAAEVAEVAIAPVAPVTPVEPAVPAVTAPPSREDSWLWDAPPGYITLQIVASSNRAGINRYIDRNLDDFRAQLHIAHLSNNGRDWFVLLMGPFASGDEASATLAGLPADTRADKPWPRSVQSIRDAVALREQALASQN